jgi:ubiquinone/menaquinone biosynthesis C-methylase UbiE
MVRYKIQSLQISMPRNKAHFEDQEPFLEKLLSFFRFKKIIKHIPANSKVLDIGCGYQGKLLLKLQKKISCGIGFDISIDSSVSNEKIQLLSHDLNQPLPANDKEFDVVVSLANLEHLENPKRCLQEIFRVLKPGGKLLLTAPSTYAKPVLEFLALLGLVSKQEIRDHKNYFTKKILMDSCREISFRDIKHQYFQLGMNNFLIAVK